MPVHTRSGNADRSADVVDAGRVKTVGVEEP
jgi:hypothetical protein